MHCIAMVVLFAFCYLIIIYSFIKTRLYFRNAAEYNDGIKSRRLLKLQNQITWALCLQAILPTINVSELIIQTTALPILLPGVRTIHVMVYAAIPLPGHLRLGFWGRKLYHHKYTF
uniref:G protein-coupled receptor n=1 Tax=Panagrolaimus sp. PS1159 TaxID=55785 RepID=A0AC35GKT3_9BILA